MDKDYLILLHIQRLFLPKAVLINKPLNIVRLVFRFLWEVDGAEYALLQKSLFLEFTLVQKFIYHNK